MNIRASLLNDRSKENWTTVSQYIGTSEERFAELMDSFFTSDKKLTLSAGQVMSYCSDKYPFLLRPYYEKLLTNLQNPTVTVAVKRNTVRVLQEVDLPEDLMGLAAEICFAYLDDPKETIAVRAFSMAVCYNICLKEPELAHELKVILEDHVPHGSTGFKNRGTKILKKLEKLIKE